MQRFCYRCWPNTKKRLRWGTESRFFLWGIGAGGAPIVQGSWHQTVGGTESLFLGFGGNWSLGGNSKSCGEKWHRRWGPGEVMPVGIRERGSSWAWPGTAAAAGRPVTARPAALRSLPTPVPTFLTPLTVPWAAPPIVLPAPLTAPPAVSPRDRAVLQEVRANPAIARVEIITSFIIFVLLFWLFRTSTP